MSFGVDGERKLLNTKLFSVGKDGTPLGEIPKWEMIWCFDVLSDQLIS